MIAGANGPDSRRDEGRRHHSSSGGGSHSRASSAGRRSSSRSRLSALGKASSMPEGVGSATDLPLYKCDIIGTTFQHHHQRQQSAGAQLSSQPQSGSSNPARVIRGHSISHSNSSSTSSSSANASPSHHQQSSIPLTALPNSPGEHRSGGRAGGGGKSMDHHHYGYTYLLNPFRCACDSEQIPSS